MQCPKCKREIRDDAKYCRFCGTRLQKQTTEEPGSSGHSSFPIFCTVALAVMLLIGYVLYPKNMPVTISGTYSDGTRELELKDTGEAVFTDMDGITYSGSYTVSRDHSLFTLGLVDENGKSVEMIALADNQEMYIFQKKSSYEAIRYRLSQEK